LTCILIIAAVCRVAMMSWGVFVGVTVVVAAILIHGGDIHPNPSSSKANLPSFCSVHY